jgi:hypothetical protein
MTDTSHRRALHCYYTARDQNQQTNQQDRLTASTRARLSPLQRWILDVVWLIEQLKLIIEADLIMVIWSDLI